MFVQADEFTKHSGKLSFYGQESKDFTYRLCRMNLFIHGIDGKIELGNSYVDDKHATLKAEPDRPRDRNSHLSELVC